jgi:tripartite-type tricarboxylate transporter receptor subunit TctC
MLAHHAPRMLVAAALAAVFGPGVCAQDYPNKPVRIITNAAGGDSDFAARQMAQGITGPLGQPVVIDNRATTLLSSEAAAQAAPDGYTLHVNGTSLWIGPLLRKVPYGDFSPISLIVRDVTVVSVHPSVPVKNIRELVALAKARPGELNYGSTGVGSTAHLSGELFKSLAGVNIVNVPYKGTAAALTGLVSGEVHMLVADVGSTMPHMKAGKLRALAVTSNSPSILAPGLATVSASGLPGYEMVSLTGIFAPSKTPAAIVNRLNQEVVRVLNMPEVKSRFLATGKEAMGTTPDELGNIIKTDMARVGKVIRDAGIKLD